MRSVANGPVPVNVFFAAPASCATCAYTFSAGESWLVASFNSTARRSFSNWNRTSSGRCASATATSDWSCAASGEGGLRSGNEGSRSAAVGTTGFPAGSRRYSDSRSAAC